MCAAAPRLQWLCSRITLPCACWLLGQSLRLYRSSGQMTSLLRRLHPALQQAMPGLASGLCLQNGGVLSVVLRQMRTTKTMMQPLNPIQRFVTLGLSWPVLMHDAFCMATRAEARCLKCCGVRTLSCPVCLCAVLLTTGVGNNANPASDVSHLQLASSYSACNVANRTANWQRRMQRPL